MIRHQRYWDTPKGCEKDRYIASFYGIHKDDRRAYDLYLHEGQKAFYFVRNFITLHQAGDTNKGLKSNICPTGDRGVWRRDLYDMGMSLIKKYLSDPSISPNEFNV